MYTHPLIQSMTHRIKGSLLILLVAGLQGVVLLRYGQATPMQAWGDSILSTGLLTVAGFFAWFVLEYIRVWQVQLFLAFLVQLVCLGISFTVMTILGLENQESFLYTLPLRFVLGLLCWIILLQWYENLQNEQQCREMLEEERMRQEKEKQSEITATFSTDCIDRISVKDGSRIHIVHLEELYCLQASGDYVTLFTSSGQYIKEQTMKYFEQHLPLTFVRIHRSSIVNTDFIARVELFGKENYQVKLKNGTSLRASTSGYKLLKERLSL
ncbi:LytTR family transcriptional regulator [Parabacteroides sp. 52]|uniref:LytR/AlgR family response regulator transcription factor n=1 Tax=unclassified Parabacteroides TaxID=2649774 RepID=UPI0013D51280|nr:MULTISPECIES: LytTR family DNA-binding domain-containing protein [unclassified Parabacteroides]MDH6535158.1 hypothetical protein [Parabacteroides sp. PM5-20]NDV56198.1 LytTR family transcriptional regulator [Parabacteroides sp. 52]